MHLLCVLSPCQRSNQCCTPAGNVCDLVDFHDDLVVDLPVGGPPVDVMFINLLVFQLIFPANDTPIDGPYELLIVVPVDGS